MCAFLHAIVKVFVQFGQIYISALSHLSCSFGSDTEWVQTEEWYIILQVSGSASELAHSQRNCVALVAGSTNLGDLLFNLGDLME